MAGTSLDTILEGFFGRAISGARSEVDRYGRWAVGLAKASQEWLAFAQAGHTCGCRVATNQGPAICRMAAIGPCTTCGGPVCLEHALVSHTMVVCMGCVGMWRTKEGRAASASSSSQKTRAHYLNVLGLKDGVSDEDIKQKYKKLAVQHHPDHAKNAADRARRTKRMKEINEAYAALQPKAA